MKVHYYVAASVDGFIADAEGGVGWLDELAIPLSETGFHEFFASVDGVIMGRKTYDQIRGFGQWPYGDRPTWVCTSGDVTEHAGCALQLEHTPEEAVSAARRSGVGHLWVVGGGVLASALLERNLLTDLSLCQMPVLLGSGIPLFAPLDRTISFELKSATVIDAGAALTHYEIKPG